MKLHPDWRDFIEALLENQVEFVIVGAFAVGYWGRPRATGDLDVWVRPTKANGQAVLQALKDFGFVSADLTEDDLISGKIIQLGREPVRIDILSSLSGVAAEEIWENRAPGTLGGRKVFFIGKEVLRKNKLASGRKKDLLDLDALGEA